MTTDIVLPGKKNQNLLDRGALLGYDTIIFAHPPGNHDEQAAILIEEVAQNKIRSLLQKHTKNLTIVRVCSEEQMRYLIDKTKVNMLIGMEYIHDKDHFHYRKSGLHQIICKRAESLILGFSFSEWIKKPSHQILGRLRQNLRFAKKYKIPYMIFSLTDEPALMRAPSDLKAFMRSLYEQALLL